MMTHAYKLYDIQQVPSLPLYWYDPITQLVFSDGFTVPFLPYSCTDTGGLPGEHQETTRETAGKVQDGTSTVPVTVQEDASVPSDIAWLLTEDGGMVFYIKTKKVCASKCLPLYLQANTCLFMEARRDVFQAIADPTRRAIIGLIAKQPINVNTIAEQFDMSRQAISLHLKILVECDLVTMKQEGRERICKAKLEKLSEVNEWITQYKQFWETKLDALGKFLNNTRKSK
jgi:DNA-binding transcriptional ArsR family regulator